MARQLNPYLCLGITPTSTREEIDKAYRRLIKETHPDAHHGNLLFTEAFKDLNESYDILTNPDRWNDRNYWKANPEKLSRDVNGESSPSHTDLELSKMREALDKALKELQNVKQERETIRLERDSARELLSRMGRKLPDNRRETTGQYQSYELDPKIQESFVDAALYGDLSKIHSLYQEVHNKGGNSLVEKLIKSKGRSKDDYEAFFSANTPEVIEALFAIVSSFDNFQELAKDILLKKRENDGTLFYNAYCWKSHLVPHIASIGKKFGGEELLEKMILTMKTIIPSDGPMSYENLLDLLEENKGIAQRNPSFIETFEKVIGREIRDAKTRDSFIKRCKILRGFRSKMNQTSWNQRQGKHHA